VRSARNAGLQDGFENVEEHRVERIRDDVLVGAEPNGQDPDASRCGFLARGLRFQ